MIAIDVEVPAASRLPDAASAALAEAAAFRMLALAFERPRPGWREELAALAAEVRDPALAELARLAGDADEGLYHALMGPGGAVSARAVAHSVEDPGRILADIALQHEAFGYRPALAEEPIDHLAVVIDFVAYLWLKEAWPAASGKQEAAAVARLGRERFVARRLAPLARRFARRLGGGGPAYLVVACTALVRRMPASETSDEDVLPPGLSWGTGDGGCEGCSELCEAEVP